MNVAAIDGSKHIFKIWPEFWIVSDLRGNAICIWQLHIPGIKW